jgi:YggT family protein
MFLQDVILRLLDVYSMIIIIRVVFSWFITNPYNQLYIVLVNLTEPFLGAIRKQLHRLFPRMMLDFSPLLAILLINFIANLVRSF